ncbi:hypothetical protein PILCRDRAFT_399181 [Piloderma croceum F 1598]|uniref:Uncharacterized protein n=1 Tax=Piloderma croceum (strain F 1598) TaxID=765440 RepID=A0A0C3BCU6_PILCF|nr:hypothetical protein PILCRDRAFT_399181 [Piloderma croceum F 1598]
MFPPRACVQRLHLHMHYSPQRLASGVKLEEATTVLEQEQVWRNLFKGHLLKQQHPLDLHVGFCISVCTSIFEIIIALEGTTAAALRVDLWEYKTLHAKTFQIDSWTIADTPHGTSSYGIPDSRYHRDNAVKFPSGLISWKGAFPDLRPIT